MTRAALALVALACALPHPAEARRRTCAQLAALRLPDTTITLAETVDGGTFAPPDGSDAITGLPAFCRVAGTTAPTADSAIRFETWIPLAGWNGKLNGVGNGAFAGTIRYDELAGGLVRGYAAAGSDTGHVGVGPLPGAFVAELDARWALGHPEKVIDFGLRSLHLTTRNAKAIVRAFRGRRPAHAYYTGCSTGGRQGLMEAQQFPADYDGFVIGAPAYDWTHLQATMAWLYHAKYAEPGAYIPAAKLPALAAAVNAQCDAADGIVDGVLDDPRDCAFDPASLACPPGQDTNACLTPKQVATLAAIYAGPHNLRTGERIFPGYLPGAETGTNDWSAWITNGSPGSTLLDYIGTQYFKYFVFQDPSYDLLTFDFDADLATNDASIGKVLNATDPDLHRLKRRGGRVILWHGWNDPSVPALGTVEYYERVLARFAGRRRSRDEALHDVRRFVRLFMAPGVHHCADGPGPNRADMLGALEAWVEHRRAPDQIVATHETAGVVDRSRPLCPYPERARYGGTGSTDEAASFTCR